MSGSDVFYFQVDIEPTSGVFFFFKNSISSPYIYFLTEKLSPDFIRLIKYIPITKTFLRKNNKVILALVDKEKNSQALPEHLPCKCQLLF